MKRLTVYFADLIVGYISLDSDNLINFDYSSEWLENKNAFALSQQLPLERFTFVDVAQMYFSNLLPEGKIRKILSAKFRISDDNDFQMLAQIGSECAGAISIRSEKAKPKIKNKRITLAEIEKNFTEQPIIQLGLKDDEIRLSLAGAQDKITLIKNKNDFEIPLDGSASTYILKMPSRDYKNIIENEKFVTDLAELCDFKIMPSEILKMNRNSFLLVRRYDRIQNKNKIERLHQEDFCQALGFSYKNKYQEEGGPSFKQCFDLVADCSELANIDLDMTLKWNIFNIAVGNCDNHGKNLSLLKNAENNKWVLSPIYDLVCTRVYKTISKKQAMSVGGKFDTANLALKHWLIEFDLLNYKFSRFRDQIAMPVIQTIYLGCEVLLSEKKSDPLFDFYKQLANVILTQSRRVERSLWV